MVKKLFFTVILFIFLLAACNENNDNTTDEFIASRDFVFDTAVFPSSLIQEESFSIYSIVYSFAPMPEEYAIEDYEDLDLFNETHTSDINEYMSINDLDTYTYFFIRNPGCPDYFDYSNHNYNNNQLTITLDHYHEPDVACPAIEAESYLVFKARKILELIKVFKYDGSVQCENNGIPLDDMEQELTDAGVIIYCSQKGSDGMAYPSVCGGATGSLNIYEIDILDLPITEELGFESVEELIFYEDQSCMEDI